MAALERDFTMIYVEAAGLATVDLARGSARRWAGRPGDLLHVWLHGEAYGAPGSKEVTGP